MGSSPRCRSRGASSSCGRRSSIATRSRARTGAAAGSWSSQIALALGFFAFATYAGFVLERDPAHRAPRARRERRRDARRIALFITIASATQDIALDAYSVEVLEPEEQGPASGLRVMWYRIGMLVAGALAIFSAQWLPWPAVFALLGVLFLASIALTLWAEPPARPAAAPRSLAAAVVEPFRTYFGRPQALTVAAFLVFYKFGDNAAGTMVNPFLKDMCFSNAEIGLAVKVIGTAATIGGTGLGAALMARLGLGRALWVFGVAQAGAIGFYALAAAARTAPLDVALCATLSRSRRSRAAGRTSGSRRSTRRRGWARPRCSRSSCASATSATARRSTRCSRACSASAARSPGSPAASSPSGSGTPASS